MVVNYTLSDVLGSISIGCWLCAQFPQLLENIRRQSCEGLALPFLANWFLGDISNLIGCILTHQLPFQTHLATYFVFVDCMLLVQYIYYYQPPKMLPPIHGHLRSAALPLPPRRFSIDRYRTLSAVASNVANAAALAAIQDEPESRHTSLSHRTGMYTQVVADRETEYGDEDREPPTDMTESFRSEGGRGSSSKRVSWSIERSRNRAASVGHAIRRPPRLNLPPIDGPNPQNPEVPSSHEPQNLPDSPLSPTSATARSSQATRRGSTLVFLGVWTLFSFGTLSYQGPTYSGSSTKVGRVLSNMVYDVRPVPLGDTIDHARSINIRSLHVPELTYINQQTTDQPLHDNSDSSQQSSEQVVGRIFAWACATLYFTSRLPQIWKNYVRKSVEGLSMYLFIFAFLGNTFYVASIICSFPHHEASSFIRESIPYLLGSGGTLMFDITIVSQSFCYRPRRRRHSTVHARAPDEEESGLLSDDALSTPAPTESSSSFNRGRTSHVLTST